MINKSTRKIIAIVIIALLALGVIAPVLMTVVYADSKLDDLQAEFDKIVAEQKEIQDDIKKNENESKSAATQKNETEREITNLEEKITVTDELIKELNNSIEIKESESVSVQADIDAQLLSYAERVRENFERGEVDVLDVFFGSSSFSEMLTRIDYEQAFAEYDKELTDNLREDKEDILNIKNDLEEVKTMQEELSLELQTDKELMEEKANSLNSLINSLENDNDELVKLYEDLEDAEKKLDAEITAYLASLAASEYVGGEYIWPVPGFITITSQYGYRTHPVTGAQGSFHTGVDIGGYNMNGSQILAANAGKVVVSTYNSAYGNYILIDHGGGKATMYAHAQKVFVKEGDYVKQGEQIALVGTTGLSTGPHLHFEVRIDGKTVNPLEYVQKK